MSHAINPDVDVEDNMNPANTNGKNNNNNNNSNNNKNSNDKGVSEMKTQDKVKIMASQMKEKSKENAKKMAEKTKDRLSLEGQLRQAKISLERFVNPKILNRPIKEDTLIPKWVLKKAKGIVFLTVIKAGFLFAGNVGTGCVIVRKPNGGWTGPSSIAVAGVSFGFLAGASKVDYLMILPDDAAVKQFTGNGQLRLGAEVQVALGPVGREASGSAGAGDKGLSVIYSYSHAQGLYGGLAFDGKVMSVRPDCNDKYYGKKTTCFEILTGEIEAPLNEDYDMIVHLLDSYCNDDLTPMKGERISIDDLDKETNRNYENDSKYNNNNNNGNDSNDELIVIPTNDESFEYFSVYNTHSWFLLPLWNLLRDFGGFRMIIAWIPFYLGVWVSCTRITDYKHHYGDVTAGVCLGIGCALAAENVYYNELYGNLIWMYNNINVASNESRNDAQLQEINTDNNEKN